MSGVLQVGRPPQEVSAFVLIEGELLIDDSDAQRFVVWHALQLNSLVRMHLHTLTQETGRHTCCYCTAPDCS